MHYVNISGLYGFGMDGAADYRTLQDLIADMDRLGIWASVATHVAGRDINAAYGNSQLMADIAADPGAASRILPSFVLAPAMLFAPEAFGHLEQNLANGQVGFVTVYPMSARHSLLEIERILSLIAAYKPVILISANELRQSDYPELVQLARRFPDLHFVVMYAMWGQYPAIADVLWRCANVHLDISRLHMRGAIESAVSQFGSGRAIFGLGSPALNGAAMASLCYAEIEEDEKEAIAGRTILSLIGNRKKAEDILNAAVAMRPKVANSYWEPFLQKKGVENTLVIDAHGHIGPHTNGWLVPGTDIGDQVATLGRDLKRFGIARIISSSITALMGPAVAGNDEVADRVAGREDQFSGYYVYNPFYADEMTEEIIENRLNGPYFVGFKLLPDYWRVKVDDPVFTPVWEYAARHHLPILIHTWEGQYDSPERVAKVAAAYPDALFLLGHAGGGAEGRAQAVRAAREQDNIYLEYCGSFTAKTRWEDTLGRVDRKKVVFGTDTWGHSIAWELGRLLSSDIDDQTMRLILGENMARILSMRT